MDLQNFDFKKTRILIIGDVMLDRYWHGGTSRISPEAPVPVVHINHINERPGGAANVVLGVAALGANPYLLGLTGADHAAEILESLLVKEGIKYQFDKIEDHATITKLRVLSRNQQMIRLDMEGPFTCEQVTGSLKHNYTKALENVDVVILSDYAKGTLSDPAELIRLARLMNIPVIVDPKSQDFSVYHGANIITPNLKEFEAVVGPCQSVDVLVQKAQALLKQYDMGAILITRSEHGLSIILDNGEVAHIPSIVRAVHDVTGAGDTVVAVLSVALAAGMDLINSATLGNIAAGIAVGKLGAAAVSLEELEWALGEKEEFPIGVMTEEALVAAVRACKAKGERIVFTNGCFDILHAGHVMYLEQAKRLGDRVIVAVNDSASVSRLKGPTRPINTLEDRMNVLAGLRSVDWVVPFSEDTPERIIKQLAPNVLVKGGDYKDLLALPGAQFVLSQGGEVKLLGFKEGYSTTQVIEAITLQHDDSAVAAV